MVSLNKVLIVGNLTKDPELRYTPQGTAVSTLRVAVNSVFKDKTGQNQKEACFVNVVVWGQLAEVCNQYLQKGRQVFVEGRLQSRSWQGNDGTKRNTIEVRADRVQFMPQGAAREENRPVDLGSEPDAGYNLGTAEEENSQQLDTNSF